MPMAIKNRTFANNGKSTYQFDAVGQLTGITHQGPSGELLEQLTYTYDPAGNQLRSARLEGGSDEDNPTGAAKPADIEEYTYDALNQLVQVQQLNGDRTSYSYDAANKLQRWESGSDYKDYTYDLRGNLLQVNGIDSEAAIRGFTLRSALPEANVTGNVYNSTNAAIDPASMASALTTPRVLESYTWDAANRLIDHVNYNGDKTSYGYDGDNNRVSMNISWGNGNAQNQYPNGHPAGMRDGWETQYKQQQRNIYFANDVTLA